VTADVDLALIRPALEAAVVVARAGELARPRVPAPSPLRKFTSFTKLPDRALDAAWRALDDDVFRARVLTVVRSVAEGDDESFGPASLLVLERPEGWHDRLAELAAAAQVEADERSAAATVEQLERRLAKADAEVARLRAALVVRDHEVSDLHAQRSVAEGRLVALERDRARTAEALAGTTTDRAEAVRQLQDERALLAGRDVELRELRAELAVALDELERSRRQESAVTEVASTVVASTAAEVPSDRVVDEVRSDVVDEAAARQTERLARLAAAVAAAGRAADALGAALADASVLVGGEVRATEPTEPTEPTSPTPRPARRADDARRRPAPLPTGTFDDGADAAWFLVRLPGAILVVDGYNVTMASWPDQPLGVQRRMLVDGLRNLQARTGVEPLVVFDGAEPDSGPAGSLPRSVQVRFSPAGVKADDVVVDLVDRYPADRPVIVVTNDREVRDGASARGANLLRSEQLGAMLRTP